MPEIDFEIDLLDAGQLAITAQNSTLEEGFSLGLTERKQYQLTRQSDGTEWNMNRVDEISDLLSNLGYSSRVVRSGAVLLITQAKSLI